MWHYWKEKILLELGKSYLGKVLGRTSLLCKQQSGIVGLWCWKVLELSTWVALSWPGYSMPCTFPCQWNGAHKASFIGLLQYLLRYYMTIAGHIASSTHTCLRTTCIGCQDTTQLRKTLTLFLPSGQLVYWQAVSWIPAVFYHASVLQQELPWWLNGKESTCQCRRPGSIPGSGRSPEKEMTTHSSILAWEIPWTRSLVGYSPWGHELEMT